MPSLQPQLTGVPTESMDCGVRATSMAVDWATGGVKVPPVKVIRTRMGLDPTKVQPTNVTHWATAIESYDTSVELDGKYERLTGERVNAGPVEKVRTHLREGGAAIVAVDYGRYRRLMPARSGSESFDGYHAILFVGLRDGKTRSFDSLLDGRYPGCPRGPILVPWTKVQDAAVKVGRETVQQSVVYAYLVDRATVLGGGVDPEPPEEEGPTLSSVIADLREMLPGAPFLESVIADLESIIGPYRGQATPEDDPAEGVER